MLDETLAAGLRTASLWANVPVYLDASPNPRDSLALLERLNKALKLERRLHDLEVFRARFDAQSMVDELERLLREQRNAN